MRSSWKCINEIYGTSKVIGIIITDQGIQRFVSIWVVVMYDKILSITILGGYFVVTKIGANLVSPLRYHCRIFCRKVMFGVFFVIYRTESFGIICFWY